MHNPAAPKILNDIVDALKTANLKAVTDDEEGRVNSKKDESNVVNWLLNNKKFKSSVRNVGLRQFGDLIVTDNQGIDHYVNIKTLSNCGGNALSKPGFLWAFTDLPIGSIPQSVSDDKFYELVTKHKKETKRDYWFLCFNKSNMNEVLLRGTKQVEHWQTNPTNNVQIKWDKERVSSLKEYSFEEAFERVIINGVFASWAKQEKNRKRGIDCYYENQKQNSSRGLF